MCSHLEQSKWGLHRHSFCRARVRIPSHHLAVRLGRSCTSKCIPPAPNRLQTLSLPLCESGPCGSIRSAMPSSTFVATFTAAASSTSVFATSTSVSATRPRRPPPVLVYYAVRKPDAPFCVTLFPRGPPPRWPLCSPRDPTRRAGPTSAVALIRAPSKRVRSMEIRNGN